MRYQQPIYIQNQNSAVRNKDFNNVNMSSDICIFAAPLFNMTGATKLDCSGYTGTTHVITTATTIPLYFNFTGNTGTFTANTPTFNYVYTNLIITLINFRCHLYINQTHFNIVDLAVLV